MNGHLLLMIAVFSFQRMPAFAWPQYERCQIGQIYIYDGVVYLCGPFGEGGATLLYPKCVDLFNQLLEIEQTYLYGTHGQIGYFALNKRAKT